MSVKPISRNLGKLNPNWRGGTTGHPLYEVYMEMRARCERSTHKRFADYGGRGISVCSAWRESFWNFVEDMGERPAGKIASGLTAWTLDRKNNDGNYDPSNCRWATWGEQVSNRRPSAWRGVLRGEKQKNHKLNNSDILKIREEISRGVVQARIAERYEVSASLISKIKKGKAWSWL